MNLTKQDRERLKIPDFCGDEAEYRPVKFGEYFCDGSVRKWHSKTPSITSFLVLKTKNKLAEAGWDCPIVNAVSIQRYSESYTLRLPGEAIHLKLAPQFAPADGLMEVGEIIFLNPSEQ